MTIVNQEWKYVKQNISLSNIQQFEQLVDIKLDQNTINFILKHNNGRPKQNQFDINNTKELLFEKLLSFNAEDIENVFVTYKNMKNIIPSNCVPIAIDPFGNYICFDKQDQLNLVFWQAELDNVLKSNKSFLQVIKELY